MRPDFLNLCLTSLCLLIASAASPQEDLSEEPSCDQLRAMWRFSKRQSRSAKSTNEIPTYRDPFVYNVWETHANIRSAGGGKMRRPPVYGRLVHNGYQRGIEDMRIIGNMDVPEAHGRRKPTSMRVVGGNGLGQMKMNNAQSGSFQRLKELIQSERARELHEQKMSEESAARASGLHDRSMTAQDSTDLVTYGHSRSRTPQGHLVNFSDGMAPSNGYHINNYNYMQRSYPDSLRRGESLHLSNASLKKPTMG